MRLFLSIFVTMFLVVGSVRAEITVGAAGQVTSFTAAQQTATATPNSVIRYIDDSVTGEQLTVGAVNTSLTLELDGHTWGAPNNASYCLNVGAGMVGTFTCNNGTLSRAVTESGALNRLVNLAPGALGVVNLKRLKFVIDQSFPVNTALVQVTGAATSSTVIERCESVTLGGGALFNFGLTHAGTATVKSSRCSGSSFAGIRSVAVLPVSILYCDILDNAKGIIETTPNVIMNTIFAGNTIDRDITGTGSTSDFTYNAYTNSNADPGTGSITITAARTFCDQNNYWISPASLTLNAGVSIDGVTGVDLGLNGVKQGSGGILGMGCNPYSLALCGGYGVGK